jgi:hypothetical protein
MLVVAMTDLEAPVQAVASFVERVGQLNAEYRTGKLRVNVPAELLEHDRPLDDVVSAFLPASRRALDGASQGLFLSLPVAFDAFESVGPYLATVDSDSSRVRDGAGLGSRGYDAEVDSGLPW